MITKKFYLLTEVIVMILSILLIASCAASQADMIIGQWKQVDRDIVLEFRRIDQNELPEKSGGDFSGALTIICGEVIEEGYYRFDQEEDGVLVLHIKDIECDDDHRGELEEPISYYYHIDKLTSKELIISSQYDSNNPTRYVRVNNHGN